MAGPGSNQLAPLPLTQLLSSLTFPFFHISSNLTLPPPRHLRQQVVVWLVCGASPGFHFPFTAADRPPTAEPLHARPLSQPAPDCRAAARAVHTVQVCSSVHKTLLACREQWLPHTQLCTEPRTVGCIGVLGCRSSSTGSCLGRAAFLPTAHTQAMPGTCALPTS